MPAQMVIDVMNRIKRQYPFVDLLKPEQEAVVPILLALDPGALGNLRGIASTVGRRAWDAVRMKTGFLGDAGPGDDAAEGALANAQAPWLPAALSGQGRFASGAELLDRVEEEVRNGTDPMDLVRGSQGSQLGLIGAAGALATGKTGVEALREALDRLDKDRTFDPCARDSTFDRVDALVAPDIDFVVAGHTHLERALRRKRGAGFYFNSGTWARLIQLTPQMRGDAARFARIFALFQGGAMKALDAEPELVVKRCSIVSIWSDAEGRAHGELRRMQGSPAAPQMTPVAGTRFTKEA